MNKGRKEDIKRRGRGRKGGRADGLKGRRHKRKKGKRKGRGKECDEKREE